MQSFLFSKDDHAQMCMRCFLQKLTKTQVCMASLFKMVSCTFVYESEKFEKA
jgi:hypothetical protein